MSKNSPEEWSSDRVFQGTLPVYARMFALLSNHSPAAVKLGICLVGWLIPLSAGKERSYPETLADERIAPKPRWLGGLQPESRSN